MNSVLFCALVFTLINIPRVSGQTYTDAKTISDNLLSSTRYRPDLRPLVDQSSPISVLVKFQLVSIVGVNDVTQSFVCNGFLVLGWNDELLSWNVTSSEDVLVIHPHPKDIWRPRLVLLNTLGERDLFEDDASPVTISFNGETIWIPGGLFQTSCDLNLEKYPFDDQECTIEMLPMGLEQHELVFVPDHIGLAFFSPNGEWELTSTSINVTNKTVDNLIFSSFEIKLSLSRRPTFFVLNILLPVVLLSLLNMLVFTIPAESGEKVGYGITVVLAMTVFLSIVSGMLPKASDTVPSVTIYLFLLLIVSVLTVIDAIVIVFIYNQEEKEVKTMKITRQYSKAAEKIGMMNRVSNALRPRKVSHVRPTSDGGEDQNGNDDNRLKGIFQRPGSTKTPRVTDEEEYRGGSEDSINTDRGVNRYKIIGKYIDQISLVVFLIVWLIVTLWYFISVLT